MKGASTRGRGCRLMSAKGGLMMGTKKVGALPSRQERTTIIITDFLILSSAFFHIVKISAIFLILVSRGFPRLTPEHTGINMEPDRILMLNLKNRLLKREPQRPDASHADDTERLRIATCVVLLEVAKSDDEFGSLEKAAIAAILQREFQVSQEAVEALMEVAKSHREDSVDLFEFTSLINHHYGREEKIKIVEFAWHVIYADQELNRYEDHFVHKLARLFRLQHEEMIEAKLRVLEKVRASLPRT